MVLVNWPMTWCAYRRDNQEEVTDFPGLAPINDQRADHLDLRQQGFAGYTHTAAGSKMPYGYPSHTIPLPWYPEYMETTAMVTPAPGTWTTMTPG